jgi:hypothetical protein
MPDEIKNVFISHIHEDDDRLGALKELLDKHGCVARDGSINSLKPNNAQNDEYIKREILAPKIDWAGVLIVLITKDTCNSDWVNWEVEYAHEKGKRIVGVWDWGETDADLPESLKNCADAVVGWQGDRILDAINGKREFDNPDGSPRPEADMPRHNCSRP